MDQTSDAEKSLCVYKNCNHPVKSLTDLSCFFHPRSEKRGREPGSFQQQSAVYVAVIFLNAPETKKKILSVFIIISQSECKCNGATGLIVNLAI